MLHALPSAYIALDLETTGLSPYKDSILDIGAIRVEDGHIVHQFQTIINPCVPISQKITDLTGITENDILNAPVISEVMPSLLAFIADSLIVGHNIAFDIRFLAENAQRVGRTVQNKYIDTLALSRAAYPGICDHKLCTLCDCLGIADKVAHRALSDCIQAHQCYEIMRCIPSLNNPTFIKTQTERHSTRYPKEIKPSEIYQPVCNLDTRHPLFKKRIVFTGELSIDRKVAMQMAADMGAIIVGSVSSKTDYVVVGKQDRSLVGEDGMSTKEEAAVALNAIGKAKIELIDEQRFKSLLNSNCEVLV